MNGPREMGDGMADADECSWEIHPHRGVGVLTFGQSRSEMRTLLGPPTRSFRKVPFAVTDTDAFNSLGLHVYYDPDYRVESVDAFEPSTVSLDGIAFVARPVDEVVREMEAKGFRHNSLTFEDAGIALFEEDGIVRCVTIFPRGYFDLNDPNSPASRALAAARAWRSQKGV